MAEDRDKALDAALGQIEKQFGKGSVMRLGDAGAEGKGRRGAERLYARLVVAEDVRDDRGGFGRSGQVERRMGQGEGG